MTKTMHDLIEQDILDQDEAEVFWKACERMKAAETALREHAELDGDKVVNEAKIQAQIPILLEEVGRIEQRKLLEEIRDAILAPPLIPTNMR